MLVAGLSASPTSALETDIFLSGNQVKPNVLLLFDNSGSMNHLPTYDPNTVYPGSFEPNTVYHRCRRYRSNCTCRRTRRTWTAGDGSCGFVDDDNDGVDDRTSFKQIGNRRNYETGTPNKLTVAKSVITGLLRDPANANVRFGLMTYNGNWNVNNGSMSSYSNFSNWHNDTSVMRSAIQDDNQANLISIINTLSANGGTPSANRMVAAGNYFSGSFPGYSSPIQFECQRNYIINITDGIPEGEGNILSANNPGDYDYIEGWLQSKLGADIDPDDDNDDPDPNESVSYTLWLAEVSDFSAKTEITDITSNRYHYSKPLKKDLKYYWKVKAVKDDTTAHWCNTKANPYFSFTVQSAKPE